MRGDVRKVVVDDVIKIDLTIREFGWDIEKQVQMHLYLFFYFTETSKISSLIFYTVI